MESHFIYKFGILQGRKKKIQTLLNWNTFRSDINNTVL